jgi:teichuronic acid biosynthesis glycosyltransferase TuaC
MSGTPARATRQKPRVLVLSRIYPNNVTTTLGLWVRSQVRESAQFCEPKVIAPVPYCPPIPGLPENYARFRRVEPRRSDRGIESFHPRFFTGPALATHPIEWLLYELAVGRTVAALHREFPFDLIHAHFTYPDGVVAARLARRFGVPFVITEHNLWGPWMNEYPGVVRRTIRAARECACHIAVSEAARDRIEQFAGHLKCAVVIPVGVDGLEFTLCESRASIDADRILFVGAVRPIKGVDILIRALRLLVDRGRSTSLTIVGEPFYGTYQKEERRLKALVDQLGLAGRVQFVGKKLPPELTRYMQESAVLVLPSRAESLGLVLVESLACGTPVVATRCGGPEDIVDDQVGVLVAPEDPEALARGIEQVIDQRDRYDPALLRRRALERFGIEVVGRRLRDVYENVIGQHQRVVRDSPNSAEPLMAPSTD